MEQPNLSRAKKHIDEVMADLEDSPVIKKLRNEDYIRRRLKQLRKAAEVNFQQLGPLELISSQGLYFIIIIIFFNSKFHSRV